MEANTADMQDQPQGGIVALSGGDPITSHPDTAGAAEETVGAEEDSAGLAEDITSTENSAATPSDAIASDPSDFGENAENIRVEEEDRRRGIEDGTVAAGEHDAALTVNKSSEASPPVHIVALAPAADQDLAEKVNHQERELNEVKRELSEVKQELATMKGSLAPASFVSTSPPDPDALLSEARSKEAQGLEEDRKALARYQEEFGLWRKAATVLQQDIQATIEKAQEGITAASQAKAALPAVLQEKLQGRHQGLELIGKMLTRLTEKVVSLGTSSFDEAELQPFGEQEWRLVIQGEVSGKKVESKLRALEADRYQVVTQARDLAEGQRKRVLGFIEKQMLPILDALDEGEKLSQPFITAAMRVGEKWDMEKSQNLNQWFQTYALLRDDLIALTAKAGVQPMTITPGEIIDYTRQEPFDVVPDPQLPTEAIKEETRKGYECRLPGDPTALVLRAAQVIVVKN
jgi:molecular chaperone GrpE (heat shock protein)